MIIGKDVIAVSGIFEIDKMQFSKIEYSLRMRLDREEDMLQRIIAEETINDKKYEHKRKKTVKFMLNVLKGRYGDDNVEYDKKADAYFLTIISTMLAIKSGAGHDWKFIKWMNGTVYKRIFPEGIVKKLATRFYLMD
ncbi:MAG: hypothetical protein IPO27_01415 [Bacteroidetes bacterium]|nr:hypothetical protein [Bacteroidota bacterium]